MAKGKITFEWGRWDGEIVLRKDKGKLTLDEIWKFMHSQDMLNQHENDLVTWVFRIRRDREPDYMSDLFEDQGDSQVLYVLTDGDKCPICGKVATLYCPECGWPLKEADDETHQDAGTDLPV